MGYILFSLINLFYPILIILYSYYGFGLWLPELFNRFENYHKLFPEKSVSVCKLIHETDLQTAKNVLINSTNVDNCSPNMDQMVFINSLTINAFCLLGNIMSGFLANRVGRRTIPGNFKLI